MPEITSETWKETYMQKLREARETGKSLEEICGADPVWMKSHEMDQADDRCGGRACNECEIGGCDHGIISDLDPNLMEQMKQNAECIEEMS
jgi:hypothetical protein